MPPYLLWVLSLRSRPCLALRGRRAADPSTADTEAGGLPGTSSEPRAYSPLRWVSGSPCHVPPFVGRGLMPLSHAPSTEAGSEFQVKPLHLRPPSSQQLAMAWGGRGLSSVPSAPMLSEHRLVLGCEHS